MVDRKAPLWIDELLALVEQRVGLDLDIAQQRERLVPWVEARVRTLGLPTPEGYATRLALEPGLGEEWDTCIRALTNGQTFFRRDPEHFDLIASLIRALAPTRTAPLQAWCAATSTGEEPYTLSMLADELGIEMQIHATDINTAFLARARLGRYGAWALRNVDAPRRRRYFSPTDDAYRVNDVLRRRITFETYNLMAPTPPRPPRGGRWDLVLCRNVFLYFRPERIREIVWRISRVMAPDGVLILGSSESLIGLDVPLQLEREGGRTYYRPALAGGPAPGLAALRRVSGRFQGAAATRGESSASWTSASPSGALRSEPVPAESFPPPDVILAETEARPGSETEAETGPEAQSDPNTAIDEAVAAALRDDLPAARRALDETDLLPGLVLPRLLAGHLELRAGDFDAALTAYADAEVVDPFHPEVHLFKGLALRKAQRWEQAEEALRHALFLAPHLTPAAALLVGTYRRLGRSREAEREAARLVRLAASGAQTFAFLTPVGILAWFGLPLALSEDTAAIEA